MPSTRSQSQPTLPFPRKKSSRANSALKNVAQSPNPGSIKLNSALQQSLPSKSTTVKNSKSAPQNPRQGVLPLSPRKRTGQCWSLSSYLSPPLKASYHIYYGKIFVFKEMKMGATCPQSFRDRLQKWSAEGCQHLQPASWLLMRTAQSVLFGTKVQPPPSLPVLSRRHWAPARP